MNPVTAVEALSLVVSAVVTIIRMINAGHSAEQVRVKIRSIAVDLKKDEASVDDVAKGG